MGEKVKTQAVKGKVSVSVCTIAYNHASFIAQAMDGVLAQRGPDLEIEMIIGDDGSSDDTRRIVAEYAARYPEVIKPLFHARNLGANRNTMTCMAACTGEYIAALEGDDYWSDPNKLRLQVALLQNNPDCALCFHDAETFESGSDAVLWTFGQRYKDILSPKGEGLRRYTQLDIVRLNWFMPTASLLFRADSLPRPLPAWFEGIFSGDYTLQLLSTAHGPAIYLPRVMSRYRLHAQGLMRTSAQSINQYQRRVYELEQLKSNNILVEGGYEVINERLAYYSFELSDIYKNQGEQAKRFYYYSKAVTVTPSKFLGHIRRLMKRAVGIRD